MDTSRPWLAVPLAVLLGPAAAADYSMVVIEPPEGAVSYSIANFNVVNSSGLVALDIGVRDPDEPEYADLLYQAALWSARDGARRLDTLGGVTARVFDVSERGEVVGESRRADTVFHAFLWNAADGIRDLGSLGGTSKANALNEVGEVVGSSFDDDGALRAFYWSAASGMIGLDPLGADEAWALGIDDEGRVTGILASESNRVRRVFSWSADEGTVDRGPIDGEFASASDTNDAGTVVGQTRFADGEMRAFLFTADGATIDLGTLGGDYSDAIAISDSGRQTVGVSRIDGGASRAFSWTFSGGLRDLGTLGGDYSRPADVNDAGQVVGNSRDAEGEFRAFLWSEAEGIVDLNERIASPNPDALVLTGAQGITADGKIVASARPGDGGRRVYVLLVPETDPGEDDADGDGVPDADDLCPGTVLGVEPSVGATKSRFYATANGRFVDGRGTVSAIDVGHAGGCSGQQIIAAADLSSSNLRYGLWDYHLRDWVIGLRDPGGDADGDGVLDADDRCPATDLGVEPSVGATKSRFYATANGRFVDGRGTVSGFDVADAGGCSGQQIIAVADLSSSNLRYGLWDYHLRDWVESLSAEQASAE